MRTSDSQPAGVHQFWHRPPTRLPRRRPPAEFEETFYAKVQVDKILADLT